jgi:hypothetical protein
MLNGFFVLLSSSLNFQVAKCGFMSIMPSLPLNHQTLHCKETFAYLPDFPEKAAEVLKLKSF